MRTVRFVFTASLLAGGLAGIPAALAAGSTGPAIFADGFESGGCLRWSLCPQIPTGLVLLTEREPSIEPGARAPIRVRLLDPSGAPTIGALLAFAPQQSTADATLSAAVVSTGEHGVAETIVDAGAQLIDFDVRVSVPNDDTVEPLTVRVHVEPKDAADYIVRVAYQGSTLLDSVEVSLYEDVRGCATLVESPGESPSEDVAWTSLVILPDAEGGLPDRGLHVPVFVSLHYAVARATAPGMPDYFVTFGCQDSIPVPEPLRATVIEIAMHDLF